ncbi:LPXTG cell wall anchor domain-containing protein [Actinoplanes sp. NPDC089786]
MTGTNTATILGVGALLLLAGAVVAVVARRRRTRFTA